MVVVATKSFNKDISKLRDKKLAKTIEDIIRKIEKANSITEITSIKKMEGANNDFRIRIGNYRLGFHYLNELYNLQFLRIVRIFTKYFLKITALDMLPVTFPYLLKYKFRSLYTC